MQYSLGDTLSLTLMAMLIVFVILILIMLGIQLMAKLFPEESLESKEDSQVHQPESSPGPVEDTGTLFAEDPYAKVAALTALASASQGQPDREFQILEIKKRG